MRRTSHAHRVMTASTTTVRATPQETYDYLDGQMHFTIDVCANEKNHKHPRYFSERDNGLAQSWEGETFFCNPPYGKQIFGWVSKARDSCMVACRCAAARSGLERSGFIAACRAPSGLPLRRAQPGLVAAVRAARRRHPLLGRAHRLRRHGDRSALPRGLRLHGASWAPACAPGSGILAARPSRLAAAGGGLAVSLAPILRARDTSRCQRPLDPLPGEAARNAPSRLAPRNSDGGFRLSEDRR
jgi:hypothetical protein